MTDHAEAQVVSLQSVRRRGFDPRSDNVGLVADKVPPNSILDFLFIIIPPNRSQASTVDTL